MKISRRIVIAVALVIVFGSVASAQLFSRSKYESAKYEVKETDGDFEIRDYPELVVAAAPMSEGDGDRNSAFRKLFGYISGKNATSEKIAMTTPVFMTPKKGKEKTMAFVVPAKVAKAGAPSATDKKVKVTKRAAGKFAVYRYSGRWTEEREKKSRERLKAWLKDKGLVSKGAFETAAYDPPFTPGFLRRNEILVRVE